MHDTPDTDLPNPDAEDELAAPLDEAPPVPADDPEIGVDGVGAGDLP